MVRPDHCRASSVTPLDAVGESVVDARIDVELSLSTSNKLALDLL